MTSPIRNKLIRNLTSNPMCIPFFLHSLAVATVLHGFSPANTETISDPILIAGIHQAVLDRNADATRKAINAGADVNATALSDLATLHLAASLNWAEGAELLLAAGANPDRPDRYGWTPLHFAADGGSDEVLQLLLSAGADPNAQDQRSSLTPLHRAAFKGHAAAVERLLAAGAEPNSSSTARRSAGLTPLHWAASTGKTGAGECVELLIQAGGDVAARDEYQMTPLHFAALARNVPATIALLAAAPPLDARNDRGQTPLHFAVIADSPRIIGLLLKAGASANVPDGRGSTPRQLSFRMSEDTQAAFDNTPGNKLPLSGWLLRMDPQDVGQSEDWHLTEVDSTGWQSTAVGTHWEQGYVGVGWYRLLFSLPHKPTAAHKAVLRFEGVDEEALVWLNGVNIGGQQLGPSGWDKPFDLNVTEDLRWNGTNTLTVRVENSVGGGGIWRPVVLKVCSENGKPIDVQIGQ